MCGIVGLLPLRGSWHTVDRLAAAVEVMTTLLAHRGPDDRGTWIDPRGKVALGHTRLAVLDLSQEGHQPMESSDGRLVVSFNGEIYNFPELRRKLEAVGVRFRGTSDTEVLVEGMAHWGVAVTLQRCDGMFALAVWDRLEEELLLARDRFGEKPLYYGWSDGSIVFASELKAIEQAPDFDADVDRDALAAFLRYGYVPAPVTIYEGICKLPPGHLIRLSHDAPNGVAQPFWSLDEVIPARRPFHDRSVPELVDELDEHLRASIRERMIADVPLGAFLSGGIDSSLVVALMRDLTETSVRTFTIAVPFAGYDESVYARKIASHLGTDHLELAVTPSDALALVPELSAIYDEPFADSSQIPTLLVSRLAREHVTVALSGDGGDELFGGYLRYLLAQSVWRRLSSVPVPARRALGSLIDRAPPRVVHRLGRLVGVARPAEKASKFVDVLSQSDIMGVYRRLISTWPDAHSAVIGAGDRSGLAIEESRFSELSSLEWMMATDVVSYLPDDILTKIDRASMRYSLEVRVPFLDTGVAGFAWQLPEQMKVRGSTTKWILRELLSRYVPRDLFERPKMGFAVPIGQWLRGPLRGWAEGLLDWDRLRAEGYLEPEIVRQLWDEHLRGVTDHETRLWSVLMFQQWLDRRSGQPLGSAA